MAEDKPRAEQKDAGVAWPKPADRKAVLALIGPLGAGKSTAARCLARRGGRVIDGDALGHEALRQPEIREAVVRRWGTHLIRPDGSIDRRALAAIVFADPAERNALEQLVFPYIGKRLREEIACAQADPHCCFVVVDAAVLLEAGWDGPVDRLIYVEAPAPLRRQRLRQRSGWSEAEIAAREAAQWPAERKQAAAHAVLQNSGEESQLQQQVDDLLQRWGLTSCGQPTGRDGVTD